MKKVLIVGGGFGGVACAKRLAELADKRVRVRLMSDKPHFEYHGALYRLVTGSSPLEVCVPLEVIFDPSTSLGRLVEVVVDKAMTVDVKKKLVHGETGSVYRYDELVLGLGSETVYYDTPGLSELSFGFKTINEALRLKRHLHEIIDQCRVSREKEVQMRNAHIVVVGGGASGTELAAELVVYVKKIARMHGVDPSLVTVELIQSPSRLLPDLPFEMSRRIEEKVRSLGVNVYVNRRLVKEEVSNVYLKDMKMQSKTVVWTAGVKANSLYGKVAGLEVDDKGRVVVNKRLKAKGTNGVYVVGDGAATRYSGMAQTALADGKLVAENLVRKLNKELQRDRQEVKPIYAIPCGPSWAAVLVGKKQYYGRLGWWWRRYLDWVVFRSLLPWGKAWTAFRSGGKLCESCPVCGEE